MIELDEHYRLESDAYNWILVYEKDHGIDEETGKPIKTMWKRYSASLKRLLKLYVSQSLKTANGLVELSNELERTTRIIEALPLKVEK